jgi:putative ABC transport system ATP-binding protein
VSALELRDLIKHYRGESETVRAVDGVSLTLSPGEFVALYGPSGSGKTTLLLLVAGILAPDSGSVLFEGRDVVSFSPGESDLYRQRDLGVVFQSFHLMGGASALDNATIKLLAGGVRPKEARRLARPWLDRVGLSERHDFRPRQLSMGERQRVAIARALAAEPRLLLTDEPTGNLDTVRSRQILALLRDICHERNIPGLLVTHDPQAIEFVDRAHTFQDGKLKDGVSVELALQ